jgi:hypothetical protein
MMNRGTPIDGNSQMGFYSNHTKIRFQSTSWAFNIIFFGMGLLEESNGIITH